jgi:hypothetical protein
VNLESTVSLSCVRFSAGETTLRFGRGIVFFVAGMWFPHRDVSYSIRI